MHEPAPRAFSVLLLVGLWAAGAAAQTWQARPVLKAEAERPPRSAAPPDFETAPTCSIGIQSRPRRGTRSVSATRVLDIDFRVRLYNSPAGDHVVRLELETPSGHLYQTLTVPFTTEPVRPGTRRRIEGFPRPLEVQYARPAGVGASAARREVAAKLPVAGTPIVHNSLYGRWVARAYLDARVEPCGRARAFSIRQ